MKPMKPIAMPPMRAAEPWWPADLGSLSTSGTQNDFRYAFFRDNRRLIVDRRQRGSVETPR